MPPAKASVAHHAILLLLLASALSLRLGWGLTLGTSSASIAALPDQQEYLSLGRNLLDGQGLRFFDARFNDWVYAYRTPGYPLFVAACGGNVRVVRAVQAVIDVSSVLAVYLLARKMVPQNCASRAGPLLAAAFVAFNPFLIYFTGLILSESLFTSLLIWGMLLLTVARISSVARVANPCCELKRWVANPCHLAGGILLAFAVLIRPSSFFLPPLLGVAACYLNSVGPAAYQTRRPVRVAAAMSLLVLVVLFPWAWRNSAPSVLGKWIWTTTNGGITAYDGFNPAASGSSDQSFLRGLPQLAKMNEVGRSKYLESEAWRYVRENPRRAIELAVLKIARTWSPLPLSEQFGRRSYRLIALLYALPFDALVLAGLIKGRLPRRTKVFLLVPAIYFTAVHASSVGSLRYRLPVEPPMSVMIAAINERTRVRSRTAALPHGTAAKR